MLKDLSLEQFVLEVASSSPAPGGGSVSASAGAKAAGLISMYCQLSQDSKKYGEHVSLMQETGLKARQLSGNLIEAIDEDTAAFNQVMEAFRLPKESAEEKEKRLLAIQKGMVNAARVPLKTAEDCLRLLELIEAVKGLGNPGAVTDLGVGNLLALAGLIGACYNVKINLGSIRDEKIKEELSGQTEELLERGQEMFAANRAGIEKDI